MTSYQSKYHEIDYKMFSGTLQIDGERENISYNIIGFHGIVDSTHSKHARKIHTEVEFLKEIVTAQLNSTQLN